jgi:hypothetical protein
MKHLNRATIASYARSMRVMQADNRNVKAYVWHAKNGFPKMARRLYNDACKVLPHLREADRMADATLDAYLPRVDCEE